MDRDKFDQQLMGYLFDELDEIERAAVRRRLETDAESRELEQRLRATIERAKLPLVEPSPDLEERILEAASVAQQGEPLRRKVLRALSWAGSHAMRPQFAMASLLVLLLGSSLLLVRAKPGAMRVSAEGTAVPMPATATPLVDPSRGSPADEPPSVTARGDAPSPHEPSDDAAGREENGPTSDDPANQLAQAREARATAGCRGALPLFAKLRERYGASGFGADATFEEARCLRELSDSARAQQLLGTLREHPEYRQAIADLESKAAAGIAGGVAEAAAGANAIGAAAAGPAKRATMPAAPAGAASTTPR